MFGWEFPPHNTGGLGTACYGLTKSLSRQGVDVSFVLPRKVDVNEDFLEFLFADVSRASMINAYSSFTQAGKEYCNSLLEAVNKYADRVDALIKSLEFDVIHAHDWLTIKAGIRAKELTGKPLIMHVHATEFDRTGGNGVNQAVYNIERRGMHESDLVITVSNFTKDKIVKHYGVDPQKVVVVHNGVELPLVYRVRQYKKDKRIVLFLGRLTLQKGPDYFLRAARKVLYHCPKTLFLMAGKGDMMPLLIDKSIELGVSDNFIFTGYLREKDKKSVYQMADLFVMPSVSEPFGITPLESLINGTPVIISRQSGVSEVLSHCLKVDFWDVNQLTNKIVSVLNHQPLHDCLSINGCLEAAKLNWDEPAARCAEVYNNLISGS
ncbi:glycosyltransferase [archaeon]|nr:glycosyltransferase [archaeon]